MGKPVARGVFQPTKKNYAKIDRKKCTFEHQKHLTA
jgi:hypothetical protein